MFKSFSMDLAGRKLTVEVGRCGCPGKRCGIHALWRYGGAFHGNRVIQAKGGH